MAGGRPQTLTKEQIAKVVSDFEKYIKNEEDPIIVGFSSSYPPIKLKDGRKFYVNKDYMNDHDEFSDLKKIAIQKQEAFLQREATRNNANATMAVFRLKQPQHGFKDKTEVQQTNVNITPEELTKMSDEELARIAFAG